MKFSWGSTSSRTWNYHVTQEFKYQDEESYFTWKTIHPPPSVSRSQYTFHGPLIKTWTKNLLKRLFGSWICWFMLKVLFNIIYMYLAGVDILQITNILSWIPFKKKLNFYDALWCHALVILSLSGGRGEILEKFPTFFVNFG